MAAPKTILIIEDDADISNMLRILLTQNGYHVLCAYSGTEGLLVHGAKTSLILLDLMLPGKSGEEIIGELKKKHPVPVIVMSAIHEVGKKSVSFPSARTITLPSPFITRNFLQGSPQGSDIWEQVFPARMLPRRRKLWPGRTSCSTPPPFR